MAMLTWIPDVLKAAGCVVVPYAGWETRTTRASGLTVKGVVCHHTATGPNTSNTAVARLLAVGRSDLRGPLSQLGLDRDGHFWMIAAGRCNHNGYGTWGNDSIGIEAFNDGVGEPWPPAQIDAYERGCAALIARCGLSISEVRGHKETDPTRKIDPRGIDMDKFRANVARHLATEDDMSAETERKIIEQLEAHGALLATIGKRVGIDNTGKDLSDESDALLRNQRRIGNKLGIPNQTQPTNPTAPGME